MVRVEHINSADAHIISCLNTLYLCTAAVTCTVMTEAMTFAENEPLFLLNAEIQHKEYRGTIEHQAVFGVPLDHVALADKNLQAMAKQMRKWKEDGELVEEQNVTLELDKFLSTSTRKLQQVFNKFKKKDKTYDELAAYHFSVVEEVHVSLNDRGNLICYKKDDKDTKKNPSWKLDLTLNNEFPIFVFGAAAATMTGYSIKDFMKMELAGQDDLLDDLETGTYDMYIHNEVHVFKESEYLRANVCKVVVQ